MMLLNPYAFGVASVTYSIAVKGFDTGNTTGAQSFTSSAIAGVTPEAAIILGSVAAAGSSSETADVSIAMGFLATTGTALSTGSDDGRTSTVDVRIGYTDRCFNVRNIGSATTQNQATGSFVSGGISLNFTTNSTSCRAAAVCFTAVSAKNGTVSLGTGTSAITVSGVGFQPDVVFLMGTGRIFAATSTAVMGLSFGIALGNGTQRCVFWTENNGAADGAPFQAIRDDAAAMDVSATTGALTYKVVVGGFGSDGFTLTPSANAGSDEVAYLAIKFDDANSLAIYDITTPTSTGSSAITGIGFKPQLAIMALTNLEAVNSHAGASSALQGALAINFIGNDQWATSFAAASGTATTDTASNCQNTAVLGGSDTSTTAIEATLTSFDSDGMTLNYSAVQGTGKKGFILFVQ